MSDASPPPAAPAAGSTSPDTAALRRLFETSPLGICRVAPPSRLVWANPALARMLGYESAAELAGHEDVGTLFADPDGFGQLAARLREADGVEGFECPLRRKDGGAAWVLLSVVAQRDGAGKVLGYDAFVEDVTARKALEVLRDEIARMTRHDLKGPLNAVMGLSELLQDEDISPSSRELADMIHMAGRNMLDMINTSLALYQLELGQCELRRGPLDPEAMVHRVAGELENLSQARGVQVRVALRRAPGGQGPLVLDGDRLLLTAMVRHLLQNALEASPRGDAVDVDLDEEQGALRLAVRNQGAVPRDIRGVFFEKFVTTGKRRGTGVGTYVVRLVAEAHGGGVGFTSSTKQGTEVWATLPLKQPRKGAGR